MSGTDEWGQFSSVGISPPSSDEKTDVIWSFNMFAFVAVSLCKIPSLHRGATLVDSVRLPLIKLQNLLGLLVLSSLTKIRNIEVISSSACCLRLLFDFLKFIPISYFSSLFCSLIISFFLFWLIDWLIGVLLWYLFYLFINPCFTKPLTSHLRWYVCIH